MKAPLSSSKVSCVGVDRELLLCISLAACRVRSGRRPRTTFYPCRPRGAGHPILCSHCGEPGMLVGRSPLLTRGLLSGPAGLRAPSTSSAVSSSSPPSGPKSRGLRFQRRHLRDHSLLQEAPQVDQQLAGHGDDPYFPGPLATAAETLLIPKAQLAPRLIAQPAPRHLDRHRPDVSAPCLADPLLPAPVSTLIREPGAGDQQGREPTHPGGGDRDGVGLAALSAAEQVEPLVSGAFRPRWQAGRESRDRRRGPQAADRPVALPGARSDPGGGDAESVSRDSWDQMEAKTS